MEIIFSLQNIHQAAEKFLAAYGTKKIFAFYGNMGVGKTTFITALCKALGVQQNMSSPTFSIINEYNTADGQIIYHIDLYRLQNDAEAINAGVEDCLYSGHICFVEWPEKAPPIFPDDTLYVNIFLVNDEVRQLQAK